MKRVVIVLALLLVISMVSAKTITVGELFDVERRDSYAETSTETSGTTMYFYAGNKLIASKNSEVKYHYQDRLGSDTQSKQLPFGQEIYSDSRFTFTGKELDGELHYFGARYYSSSLGKFTSVDPVKENHAYSYVANNPMNYIDPDGRDITLNWLNDLDFDTSAFKQRTIDELNSPESYSALGITAEDDFSINVNMGLLTYEDVQSAISGGSYPLPMYDSADDEMTLLVVSPDLAQGFISAGYSLSQEKIDDLTAMFDWLFLGVSVHEVKHYLDLSPNSIEKSYPAQARLDSLIRRGEATKSLHDLTDIDFKIELMKERISAEEDAHNTDLQYYRNILANRQLDDNNRRWIQSALDGSIVGRDSALAGYNGLLGVWEAEKENK